MTTRADGMRRIATANTTIATFSAAGVVGLSVMLAQQGTHHTAATVPAAVTNTTETTPSCGHVEVFFGRRRHNDSDDYAAGHRSASDVGVRAACSYEWIMTLPSAQWPAIGTTALVVVTDQTHLDAAQHIVVDELAQLDLACSRFRDDSEIARLAARGNAWTPVSDVLADVLSVRT